MALRRRCGLTGPDTKASGCGAPVISGDFCRSWENSDEPHVKGDIFVEETKGTLLNLTLLGGFKQFLFSISYME